MNTKVALGIVVAAIALLAGYVVLNHRDANLTTPTPVSEVLATTSTSGLAAPAAKGDQKPAFAAGAPVRTMVKALVAVDASALAATSAYPVLTGTANVPEVTLIISTAEGVGLVATEHIPVENGKWSYATSVMLPVGAYKVLVAGGAGIANATLVVTTP
jgi:hypothetical protein